MALTEIEITGILEDGTVSWKTGKIPGQHHDEMDKFQQELEEFLGGKVERRHTAGKSGHTHHHDHQHEHVKES